MSNTESEPYRFFYTTFNQVSFFLVKKKTKVKTKYFSKTTFDTVNDNKTHRLTMSVLCLNTAMTTVETSRYTAVKKNDDMYIYVSFFHTIHNN